MTEELLVLYKDLSQLIDELEQLESQCFIYHLYELEHDIRDSKYYIIAARNSSMREL